MSTFPLKPTHKPVKAYYDALAQFQKHGHTTEVNTRSAFADLLKKCAPAYHWHLVEEFQFKGMIAFRTGICTNFVNPTSLDVHPLELAAG